MPRHPTEIKDIRPGELLRPRYWPTWAGLAVMRVMSLLPLRVSWLLGCVLGELLYVLHASRRKITHRNIARCFPELNEKAVKRMVRRNFRLTAQAAVDGGTAWWASKEKLHRLVRFRDREHYEQALASGRPVILLVGHFVALEMHGNTMASEQALVDIYKRPKNKLLHYYVVKQRNRFGIGSLLEYREGIKPAIRAMRRGEVFFYLPDQDAGRSNGIFVPFFGIQAATLPTLGRLAKLAGNAIVVPVFSRILPRGQGYEIIFKPPLDNFPTGDDVADTTYMNRVIEEAVREMPDQYFWVHKRFKTRPEGETDFYL